MVPFLKPKHISAVIIAKHKPEGGIEDMHEEGEDHPALMSAAEDLISAVQMKDAKAVAEALKAAFQIVDSEPMEDEE